MTDAIQQPKNETSCLKREFVYIEICGGGGGGRCRVWRHTFNIMCQFRCFSCLEEHGKLILMRPLTHHLQRRWDQSANQCLADF